MATFDALPAIVRRALVRSVQKWDAEAARAALDQGHSPEDVAAYILQLDANFTRATAIVK